MTSVFARTRSASSSSSSVASLNSSEADSRSSTPPPETPASYIQFQVVYIPGAPKGYGSEALPSTHVSLDLGDLHKELSHMRSVDEVVIPASEGADKITALLRYPLGNPLKKPTRYGLNVDPSAGVTRGQLVKAAVELYNEVFEVEVLKNKSTRNSDLDRWGYELDDLLLKAVEWYPDTREVWFDVVA